MSIRKALIPLLLCAALLSACDYIVLPEEDENLFDPTTSAGWSAQAIQIEDLGADGLRIDLALRNDTGVWSAMQAKSPAVLASGGTSVECDAAHLNSGGHRLAPGFQMRGYTAGTKKEPEIQYISVDCPAAAAGAGATLRVDYTYVTGELNYYEQEANQFNDSLEVDLGTLAADLSYPIAQPIEGLVLPTDSSITAINDVALALKQVTRDDAGLEFTWQTTNPGEYPSYVHIGNPPVIGADGILYGYYEIMDLASVPVTPAGATAEWTTRVAVPAEVKGLYMLLSVESKKQRLYVNYALDLTAQ